MGTIVSDPDKSDVEKVCGEFLRAFQGALSWKWDDRFETVLAEFSVDNKESIRAILERHLGTMWLRTVLGSLNGAAKLTERIDLKRCFG
jgi:hypothetical protein